MARELVPAGPFGTALYDVLQTKRRPNRLAWGAKELAEALGRRKVPIAAKTIRTWIRGETYPTIDYVIVIAEVLEVECHQLWNRAAKPINLPQDRPKQVGATPPLGGVREAQAKRHLPQARTAGLKKPGRRGTGS